MRNSVNSIHIDLLYLKHCRQTNAPVDSLSITPRKQLIHLALRGQREMPVSNRLIGLLK